MLLNALARTGFALLVTALLVTGACRSNTDRVRVLEAERAAAERDNQQSKEELARIRSELLEAQHRADKAEADRDAERARLELLKEKKGPETTPDQPATIDVGGMGDRVGDDVTVRRTRNGATIVLASDITFRAGRADLNRGARSTLKRVAQALASEDAIQSIRIEGHTDSDPIRKSGWRDNEELSLARATAVRRFLIANGISEEMLSVDGLGDKKPLESNTTKEGKARNRRVEIVLVARR